MNELPFILSASAQQELTQLMASKKIPEGYGIRLGIKGSGCAGVNYIIGFDVPGAQDKRFEKDGLVFYVEKKHLLYVSGLSIDFLDTREERGFIFEHASF